MAFRPPTFNLTVNIWRAGNNVMFPPDVVSMANLSPGRRVMLGQVPPQYATIAAPAQLQNFLGMQMELLLPARTDIRPLVTTFSLMTTADCVEVPAGTGRYYLVAGVDDVGRGFSNEYRLATILPLVQTLLTITGNPWGASQTPLPIP